MSWSYSATDLNTTTASGRLSKVCGKCKKEKLCEEFPTNPSSKDGFYSFCRPCKRQQDAKYKKSNKETVKASRKRYYESNKPAYYSRNAIKRAVLRKAKPCWLTIDQEQQILYFYSLAQECKLLTGDGYHVDHIVPLNGKGVCGLHVPWNLQVLPAETNLSKKNKFEGGW